MKLSYDALEKWLERNQMPSALAEETEEIPATQLVSSLGLDEKDRDLVLLSRLNKVDLSAAFPTGTKLKDIHTLQFMCVLPFQIKEELAGEVARLILLVNKGLEHPGFEMSEVDRVVYFRHVLTLSGSTIEEPILQSIIGTVQVLIRTFSDSFEALGSGEKTLHDILKEAE